jgi:hypothetical protein
MKLSQYAGDRIWKLPPLILHPFSDGRGPQKLMQSSRASLMLQGLLPRESHTIQELEEILLEGRYCEIRMMFFVGKDVVRWIDQCVGMVEHESELRNAGVEWQSFAALLVNEPPANVQKKLTVWGVADYRSIFTRSIGLNSLFSDVPDRILLAEDFIRNYHHYADQMYACRMASASFSQLKTTEFEFELYASGEYSRMLAKQWEQD